MDKTSGKLRTKTAALCAWRRRAEEKRWFRFLDRCALNLFLAMASVLPLLFAVCRRVPFSYEVNDDATIAQILDGSYTGAPDAHAIFVKYPLSWIMAWLYRKNPDVDCFGLHLSDVNWYLGVIVVLEGIALVAVLFRLLCFFSCNRLLLCALYDGAFLALWLPCFCNMTFSTAAAFLGCMGLLFFALESREEAWRPWNLMILGLLLAGAYCLRSQCFYMVLPFLCVILLLKYHIHFLKSVKPWAVLAFAGVLFAGVFLLNQKMYGSQEWKQYFIYNHARAYLQDYEGFPEYEADAAFYENLGISEAQRKAMARYTYCLVDGFDTEWVEETYLHVKEGEEEKPLFKRLKASRKKAWKYAFKKTQADPLLKKASFYLWFVLPPLFALTLLFRLYPEGKEAEGDRPDSGSTEADSGSPPGKKYRKYLRTAGRYGRDLICLLAFAVLTVGEWLYLAMNGRFPQRVEEAVRLLTLSAGLVLVCYLLAHWRKAPFCRLPVLLQVVLVCAFLRTGALDACLEEARGNQEYRLTYAAEKSEVLAYCGEHPENCYILDTSGFTKMSRPTDDLHQGNWFMSGSWAAYSPLYEEKLSSYQTESLGSEFLLRENVYVITKGKKNMASLLGLAEKEQAEAEVVDEIMTSGNNFFEVYKITAVNP